MAHKNSVAGLREEIPAIVAAEMRPAIERMESIDDKLAQLIPATNKQVEFIPPYGMTVEQWEALDEPAQDSILAAYTPVAEAVESVPEAHTPVEQQVAPAPDPAKAQVITGTGPYQPLIQKYAFTGPVSGPIHEKIAQINRMKPGDEVEWTNNQHKVFNRQVWGSNCYVFGKFDNRTRRGTRQRVPSDDAKTKNDGAIFSIYRPEKVMGRNGRKYRPAGKIKLLAHTPVKK